ncbi:FAD-dependent monooxygenase [Spirosoma foliorum]|uniref:FAD-dependent monooxygenase n=1 Tax=Spirosoma foliorum TaxID=2710596 RepID=A0A7G5H1A7_9BACT|nr:FAD-dependent monooxygenase [Spirosoma foliorum]QMW04899.1 FAD-dependent monooxygenase [Spirosoma foliorum]
MTKVTEAKGVDLHKMRVVVAGGGLVGLTAGIAFERLGATVTVCEQAPAIRAAGASIGLWKNATDVLNELNLSEQLLQLGTPIETWFYDAAGHRFRAEGFGVDDHAFVLYPRPQLNTLLAQALGQVTIKLQTKVIGFDEQADEVTILLENGTQLKADLLIGADGIYSKVRNQLLPAYSAQEHTGHHVWRALVPTGDEPADGSVLTVGHQQTRGGYFLTYGQVTTWMVNQFDSEAPRGTKKEEALKRAAQMNDAGWGEPLLRLIERTPEERILHNQVMYVPALPRWVSGRVALLGDAAHGLSPHISAGGTLGIEDVGILIKALLAKPSLSEALLAYQGNRIPHYETVRRLSRTVELAQDALNYARAYATFSHWMLNEGYQESGNLR